jgi:uncharacterized protein (TIGR02145 family)
MKTRSLLTMVILCPFLLGAQTLRMTFSPTGASSTVDSVKATNLRTTDNVTLPGNDTLVLMVNTGINTISGGNQQGIVFPNPFPGRTTLMASVGKAQTLLLEVFTFTGQSIARTEAFVQPGAHTFSLCLSRAGVYMVTMASDAGRTSFKVICSESSETGNRIRYSGSRQGNGNPASRKETTIYTLGYKIGDILLYRCRGGVHTTIITDSPDASKQYTVEFVPCADPDGKNYAIVHIGTQIWMAENLAWLPAVSDSSKGSDSLAYYYVYAYEGSSVADAKNTDNYKRYGVLYNWTAAMNAKGKKSSKAQAVCPSGWHLPYDEEWKFLETTLGMSQHDADSTYLRNSGEAGMKLKSSQGWSADGNGSNFSGFTALPGGYRNVHPNFLKMGTYSLFWTGTRVDTLAYYRSLGSADSGVFRLKTMRGHGFSVRCIKD